MPDDHSEVVPLLPIPNRTVKRLSADDSADARVKVGHRQALTASKTPRQMTGRFCFWGSVFDEARSRQRSPHRPVAAGSAPCAQFAPQDLAQAVARQRVDEQ